MIRYYGFLSHRTRSALRPIVYKFLDQVITLPDKIRYPQLLEASFGIDPLTCILCGAQMLFSGLTFDKSTYERSQYHRRMAFSRPVY